MNQCNHKRGVFAMSSLNATCKNVPVAIGITLKALIAKWIKSREDHVHLFLSAPPRYSPARVVQILKSIAARELFRRFPQLRRNLWGGQLWEDGYFVRSVGDEVTAEVIRRYIRYQKSSRDIQLRLFDQIP